MTEIDRALELMERALRVVPRTPAIIATLRRLESRGTVRQSLTFSELDEIEARISQAEAEQG